MRESESFDAFYARTVSNVTSQIHALAEGDPQADHAVREAYARAYQQWYEVSGYRDAESWVLDVAREALERRRSQAAPPPPPRDSGSWPGFFRQRQPAGTPQPVDPGATLASQDRPGGQPPDPALSEHRPLSDAATVGPAEAGQFGANAAGAGAFGAYAAQHGMNSTVGIVAAPDGTTAGAGRQPGSYGWAGSHRTLIVAIVAIAVLAAGALYFAFGGSGPGHAAGPKTNTGSSTTPKVQMLPAGRVGGRTSVPWSLVGAGWSVAQLSTAAAGSPDPAQAGSSAIYLVDPQGGRYLIRNLAPGAATLMAWSGDGAAALFGPGATGAGGYFMLRLSTGNLMPLNLPANVAAAGFTRPMGLNLLAVEEGAAKYKLERYNLQGAFQHSLSAIARRPGNPGWQSTCATACAALSSPDGTLAVWSSPGDEMQLVSNAGGLIRRLHVPNSGQPPSCTPISWWDAGTVLASCAATGGQSAATQLWLVPDSGSSPVPLTVASGISAGTGYDTGAWQAGGQTYVTQTTAAQCQSAPSGPGGLAILRLDSSGSGELVTVPGSTGNHNVVVGSTASRLLVLAQTSCPGSTSLLWFDPATGATQTLISGPAGQAGVIAAVPYGQGTAQAGN